MQATEFNHIASHLRPCLLEAARQILHDEDEAEDAVQDALISLWRWRERVAPERDVEPLLQRILRNCCLNILTAKRRRRSLAAPLEELPGSTLRSLTARSNDPHASRSSRQRLRLCTLRSPVLQIRISKSLLTLLFLLRNLDKLANFVKEPFRSPDCLFTEINFFSKVSKVFEILFCMQSCAKYKLTMKTSLQHLQMQLALPSDESSSEALYVRPHSPVHHGTQPDTPRSTGQHGRPHEFVPPMV